MNTRNKIGLMLSVVSLMIFVPFQCFATNSTVEDIRFLDKIEQIKFNEKEDAYYKISVDQQSKTIQLKLTISDDRFGNTKPDITAVLFDNDGTQIIIPSTSRNISNDDYTSVSDLKYYKNSSTADYSIEIKLLSPIISNISLECIVLSNSYKVFDSIELGFDFSPPTKPSTSKVTTSKSDSTEKPNKTTTTKNTTAKAGKTTAIKNATNKADTEKITTGKSAYKLTTKQKETDRDDIDGDNVEDIDDATESISDTEPEEIKVDKPPMSSKAKTSLILAGGIGIVAILTLATAIVSNNRVKKENNTDSSVNDDNDKT